MNFFLLGEPYDCSLLLCISCGALDKNMDANPSVRSNLNGWLQHFQFPSVSGEAVLLPQGVLSSTGHFRVWFWQEGENSCDLMVWVCWELSHGNAPHGYCELCAISWHHVSA